MSTNAGNSGSLGPEGRGDAESSRPEQSAVSQAAELLATGAPVDPAMLRDAVRALLTELRRRAPGRTVEVRVPPYGAIQCVEGPRHTRGTPPNVIEADPVTFVLLGTGQLDWAAAVHDGRVRASGVRADLSAYLPLWSDDVGGSSA